MAERLHVSANTLNNYLRGHTRITRLAIEAWADETGVDLAWLLGDDGDATRPIVVRPNNENEGK